MQIDRHYGRSGSCHQRNAVGVGGSKFDVTNRRIANGVKALHSVQRPLQRNQQVEIAEYTPPDVGIEIIDQPNGALEQQRHDPGGIESGENLQQLPPDGAIAPEVTCMHVRKEMLKSVGQTPSQANVGHCSRKRRQNTVAIGTADDLLPRSVPIIDRRNQRWPWLARAKAVAQRPTNHLERTWPQSPHRSSPP